MIQLLENFVNKFEDAYPDLADECNGLGDLVDKKMVWYQWLMHLTCFSHCSKYGQVPLSFIDKVSKLSEAIRYQAIAYLSAKIVIS